MKLHLPMRKRCAICEHRFLTGESFVALYGDQYSFQYAGQTEAFSFPDQDIDDSYCCPDEFQFCKFQDACKTCSDFDTPEYATVHEDCFEVFFQRYKDIEKDIDIELALNRLWLLTAWRVPFRGAPEIKFKDDTVTTINLEAAKYVASRYVGKGSEIHKLLMNLPLELIHTIHDFCKSAGFWRLARAVALADKAYKIQDGPMTFEPLDTVVSWARGKPLEITPKKSKTGREETYEPESESEPNTEPFWLRVTTQRDGITEIERLPHLPEYQAPTNSTSRYVIFACNQSKRRYEYVMRNDGFVRLFLNKSRPRIKFWNTPGPPNAKGSHIISHVINKWTTNNAIELDHAVRGITFFFCTHHSLWGFHMHRHNSPDAVSAFSALSPAALKDVYWIYFPISENDEVIGYGSMWIYGKFAAVVRTRLTGDNFTMSGALSHDGLLIVRWMNFDAPMTLVYTDPGIGSQIDMFNLYNPDVKNIPQRLVNSEPPPVQTCAVPDIAYFSASPLDNVVSATVYYIEDTEFCRGIVFEYANGGQRAIGECRLGMDKGQTTTSPTHICFQDVTSVRLPDSSELEDDSSDDPVASQITCRTRVLFKTDDTAASEEEQWQCYPMRGIVRLWFDHTSHYMRIDDE